MLLAVYLALAILGAHARLTGQSATTERGELSEQLRRAREELEGIHAEAERSIAEKSNVEPQLLARARLARTRLGELLGEWRAGKANDRDERSAFWHFPEISLFQLLNEFGSPDHLYIVPEELANLKVSVLAGFSIPKEVWPELLEWILAQRGLGVRKLDAICRQVYRIAAEPLVLETITSDRATLECLDAQKRGCYLLPCSPRAGALKTALEQLAPSVGVNCKFLLRHIALIGRCCDLLSLLRATDVLISGAPSSHRILCLSQCSAQSALAALRASGRVSERSDALSGLVAIPLAHQQGEALLLVGASDEVDQAAHWLREIDREVQGDRSKRLLWYRTRHEQPKVLAQLAKQLMAMIGCDEVASQATQSAILAHPGESSDNPPRRKRGGRSSKAISHKSAISSDHSNLIIDAKSGALVIAAPPQHIEQLREALERLDQPKQMVQIDLLLLERRLSDTDRSGIQLLRFGAQASRTSAWGLDVGAGGESSGGGITQFFLRQPKTGYLPPLDLAYQFLIAQENIQIDANPSITTINGVPATLNLIEETSINTGWEDLRGSRRSARNTYSRAKYGIKIEIVPHVQFEGERGYITLETDVSFDTRSFSEVSRPDVTTRSVKTLVRVADGESIVLGGLRQKDRKAHREAVPLLGELPGIGKLFGSTVMSDKSTEMFLFITPKIVGLSPRVASGLSREALMERPGEAGSFAEALKLSRNRQRGLDVERGLTEMLERP